MSTASAASGLSPGLAPARPAQSVPPQSAPSPGGAPARPAQFVPPQSAPSPGRMARGPAIAIALFAIRAYQRLISPAFAGHCRFTPSCSEYAHDAIARHGWMGLLLAARRLLRCHPLGSSGYDPVPGTDGGAPRSGAGPRRNREPAPARTTPEAAR